MEDSKYNINPKSLEELMTTIELTKSAASTYEAAADALVKAAVAAFNYMANECGVTGFQAGWASMQIVRELRNMKGPFGIVDGERLLYPQSADMHGKLDEWMTEWMPTLKEMAQKRIDETINVEDKFVSKDVFEHWKKLAAWNAGDPLPF